VLASFVVDGNDFRPTCCLVKGMNFFDKGFPWGVGQVVMKIPWTYEVDMIFSPRG